MTNPCDTMASQVFMAIAAAFGTMIAGAIMYFLWMPFISRLDAIFAMTFSIVFLVSICVVIAVATNYFIEREE